jgi:hypothetical protein
MCAYAHVCICSYYFAVTDGASNQTKASVSKLKPKHLSLLVKQPGINLGQLYTLKNVKEQSVVSSEKDTSHQTQDNIKPVVMSEFVSSERAYSLRELDCESNAKVSEVEYPDVLNYEHKLPDTFDRSIDDLEFKPNMEDVGTAVLEHNDLVDDPICHSQEIEDELDETAVDAISAEEEHGEPAVETMASIVPVPEVSEAKRYLCICLAGSCVCVCARAHMCVEISSPVTM